MRTVRFAHISDTHISADPDAVLYGARPAKALTRVLRDIARQQVPVDFLLHTGDVTADPDEAASRAAAQILKPFAFPTYFVAGNHDKPEHLLRFIDLAPHERLAAGAPWISYRFTCGGHRFLVLGADAPPDQEPHGQLGPELLAAAEACLSEEGPWTVVLHYPPVPLDCAWIDREMLLLDGEELHRLLAARRERIRAVLFGHVHRALSVVRDGILYASAGSTFSRFNVGPADENMVSEPDAQPEWNLVTLSEDRLLIRQHLVPWTEA